MAQQRNFSQWQNIIETHQQSGLSITQFCKQHRLTLSNFYKWRKIITASAKDPAISASIPTVKKSRDTHNLIQLNTLAQLINTAPLSSMTTSSCENPSAHQPWKITLKLPNGIELQLAQV